MRTFEAISLKVRYWHFSDRFRLHYTAYIASLVASRQAQHWPPTFPVAPELQRRRRARCRRFHLPTQFFLNQRAKTQRRLRLAMHHESLARGLMELFEPIHQRRLVGMRGESAQRINIRAHRYRFLINTHRADAIHQLAPERALRLETGDDHHALGAGSLVPEGKTLQGGYLYLGRPAEELAYFDYSAKHYIELARSYT